MSDISLPLIATEVSNKELDQKINDLLKIGLSVRQIIQQFDITLADIKRATAATHTPEEDSDDIVISVGKDEKALDKGPKKTVKDLIKEGLDLEEIIAETGAKRETIVSVLRYFAKDYKGVSIQVSIGSLKNLGVNHHLIPIILGIDYSLVEAHGQSRSAIPVAKGVVTNGSAQGQLQPVILSSVKMEADVRNMIKNGISTKKIMDTFGISYEKLATIKKRSDSPSLLSINNQRSEVTPTHSSPVFSQTNQAPLREAVSIESPVVPDKVHEKSLVVENKEEIVVTLAAPLEDDAKSKVVKLAKLNYTLPEIVKEVGIPQSEVISIAVSQKVFIPYSDQLRTDLNTVAKLAVNDRLSLNQIIDATKLSKFTLQKTLIQIIKYNGRGAEIFQQLLDDDKSPISIVEGKTFTPVVQPEPKPVPPKTPKPLVYSGNIRVGDTVKVLSESEISFREGVKWLSGRTVTVESILDSVAMVSLTYKGQRSFEIMRLGELSKPKVWGSLSIGDRVSFFENGFSYKGVVKTLPLDLPDASEIQYGVSVDGNDDRIKVASELKVIPSENDK